MKQSEIMLNVEYRFRVRHKAVRSAASRSWKGTIRDQRGQKLSGGIGFPGYTAVQTGTVRQKAGEWCWIEVMEKKWVEKKTRLIRRVEDRLRLERSGKSGIKGCQLEDVPRVIQVRTRDVLGPVGQLTGTE